MKGDEIAVSIKAPPVDGKANASLVKFLAGTLGLKPRDVAVASGLASRSKTVRVEGMGEAEARARLLAASVGGGPGTEGARGAAGGRTGKARRR
jgi:uncharacterized protein (TIGR00251 family)